MQRSILIVAIAVVIAIGAIVGALAYLTSNGSGGTTESSPCSVLSTNTSQIAPGTANSSSASSTADFTILESDPGTNYEGMNGSAFTFLETKRSPGRRFKFIKDRR